MEGAETSYVVQVVVTKEGNQYSSWSPEFDIASCGDSPEEADYCIDYGWLPT